ncbi:MAG: inositol 2-dehydrogenase [Actinomycetaceae bacterium]|nr:inositol 2-dehydrogenase [Actinomycetaceae bacterium]
MKFAIIGAGRIGQVHARSVSENPDAELTLIYDPDLGAAKLLADKHYAKACDNEDDVFSSDIDAVIVCSPTPLHPDHVRKAVAANKAVLCEKPVAGSIEEAQALCDELKDNPNPVMLGFNRRFDPSFAKVHRMVDEGKIGKLEQLAIISRDPAAPPKEYIRVSGGIFADMTIHDFDMARFFLGEIESVYTIGQNLDPELADTGDFDGAYVLLKNKEGVVASIVNSRHCATGYDQRLEAFGPDGSLVADNKRPTTVQVNTREISAAQDPYLDFFLERYTQAFGNELAAFMKWVETGKVCGPTVEDGVKALILAKAAEESARKGTVITL